MNLSELIEKQHDEITIEDEPNPIIAFQILYGLEESESYQKAFNEEITILANNRQKDFEEYKKEIIETSTLMIENNELSDEEKSKAIAEMNEIFGDEVKTENQKDYLTKKDFFMNNANEKTLKNFFEYLEKNNCYKEVKQDVLQVIKKICNEDDENYRKCQKGAINSTLEAVKKKIADEKAEAEGKK